MVFGSLLLIVLVPIALMVVAYFVSRALFRVVMAVTTALFVIGLIVGSIVLLDAYRFTSDLETGPTRFILEESQAAIETRNGSMIELDSTAIETTARTTFTVDRSFLSENATAGFQAANAPLEPSLAAIEADEPHGSFARALAEAYGRTATDVERLEATYDEQLRDSYADATQMRSYVFGQLLSSTLDERGGDALLLGMRNGTVRTEPNRLVIGFIKRLPPRIVEETLSINVT